MLCLCPHSEAQDHVHREPDHLGDGGAGDPDVRGAGGPHPQHQLELRGAGLQRGRAGNAFGASAALARLQHKQLQRPRAAGGRLVDAAEGSPHGLCTHYFLNIRGLYKATLLPKYQRFI